MPVRCHGLALGKFAPLHRGHQFLIETALAETEALTVLIYDSPEVTPIPLEVRAGWIRRLYPQVRVVEARGGPMEVGETPEICRRHEDYIIRTLGIAGITHFYSSETYGDHMSRALGAVDRRVDPERARVPISGTAIRANPHAARAFLDPIVYRDLVTHVVFLGAPSTGKSTLAEALAREFGTLWTPEYGREYWATHQVDRRLRPDELVHIAEEHRRREEARLLEADRFLFTDTNALTTLLFARHYHGSAEGRLVDLAREADRRYDLVFLCDDDITYDDTWDRSGEADRAAFQAATVAELKARGIAAHALSGPLPERIAQVKAVLADFRKYPPPGTGSATPSP